MAWKRILVIAAAAAVAAFVGWRVFLIVRPPTAAAAAGPAAGPGAPGNGARRAAPVAVEVADVTRSTLRDRAVFSGVLESRSRLVVTAKVAGRLERIPVRIGDRVTRGQLIAELDDEEYRQQLEQSRAEHEVARANVETARIGTEAAARELDRVRALQEKQIASASEFDSAETQAKRAQVTLTVAEAQLRQREVSLSTAQLRVQQTRLTAFWEDGGGPRIVAERLAEPGALLRANDPVVSLLETDPLVARLQVPESVYPRLKLGLKAEVSAPALPGRVFAGILSSVAPFLDEKTGQAQAWIEIANSRRELVPGLAVRVELEFGRIADAVTVPAGALVERGGEKGVFLVDAGKQRVSFVRVRPGASEGGRVQILEPALSGQVVTLGQHLLEDGGAVILPR